MNRFAFSKPTRTSEDTDLIFGRFREIGYDGLQLKKAQYDAYIDEPQRFLDERGQSEGAASALIYGSKLRDDGDIEALRRTFNFAQRVGAELIVLCHGVPREGLTNDQIADFGRQLSKLGKEAQDKGLKLTLHHHYNQPVMYRNDVDVFFDAAEDGAIGLTIDTAHFVKSGVEDIAEIIRDFAQVIDNFHLKDINDGDFCVLGAGTIDFKPIFEAILGIEYDGWISTDEESGADLVKAMESCLQYMKDGLS